MEWPSGEATACKAVHTGSIPVSTSKHDLGAISSAGERFPDTEEVTGSIPVSRTTIAAAQSLYLGSLCKVSGQSQDDDASLASERAELVALAVFTRATDAGEQVTRAMVARGLDDFARQVGQGPRDTLDITMADVDRPHCLPKLR